jgi:hypothetical protein
MFKNIVIERNPLGKYQWVLQCRPVPGFKSRTPVAQLVGLTVEKRWGGGVSRSFRGNIGEGAEQ